MSGWVVIDSDGTGPEGDYQAYGPFASEGRADEFAARWDNAAVRPSTPLVLIHAQEAWWLLRAQEREL